MLEQAPRLFEALHLVRVRVGVRVRARVGARVRVRVGVGVRARVRAGVVASAGWLLAAAAQPRKLQRVGVHGHDLVRGRGRGRVRGRIHWHHLEHPRRWLPRQANPITGSRTLNVLVDPNPNLTLTISQAGARLR